VTAAEVGMLLEMTTSVAVRKQKRRASNNPRRRGTAIAGDGEVRGRPVCEPSEDPSAEGVRR
jgi:hypothetical protein